MKLIRIVFAVVAMATLLAVNAPPQPAHACSCGGFSVPSETFVGTVKHQWDDDFVFVNIEGQPVGTEIRMTIDAARPPRKDGKFYTTCPIAGSQPLVGGVYRVTRVPGSAWANSCSPATFELLTAPPARVEPTRDASTWPWLGAAAIPIAGLSAAFALRRRRASGRASL